VTLDKPAPYPSCGWHQELYGLGDRCLMAGIVKVQLPDGGTATLCTTHASRFTRGPGLKANRATHRIIPDQIEAD
jgi:hypothetical protein